MVGNDIDAGQVVLLARSDEVDIVDMKLGLGVDFKHSYVSSN